MDWHSIGWLWAALTLLAALLQTFRNAAQKGLTGPLGALGATHVRFLFGLPFSLLFLAGLALAGRTLPTPGLTTLLFVAGGALMQVLATALLLMAMDRGSFVVATAYSKTEPVQIALFGLVLLGDPVTPALLVAIVVATAGVVLLAWPGGGAATAGDRRTRRDAAALGILSGTFFALAAVGFRGGVRSLGDDTLAAAAAAVALALALLIQSLALSVWLAAREPGTLGRIVRLWRPSLGAGLLGAAASFCWFAAFGLETAARVRTLGLVEVVIAGLVSRRLFAERTGLRDAAGIALVVVGTILVVNS